MQLGKLEKVKDLRSIWPHEAYDFTNWLAEDENLATLSDEIGIDIELITTEAKTGSFSTDILAFESTNSDNKIIIENQLEQTDHDHLGKIITYASGHDAKTIIWIVKKVREEHRQAIDWLNEHTDEEIKWIVNLIRKHKNDNITLGELWYKLRINKGYSRNIGSLYRIMRKLGYYKQINIKGTSKYVPKPYDTPKQLGIKWQIDVKFVPNECKSKELPEDKSFTNIPLLMKHQEKDSCFGMTNIHQQKQLIL